ncbi:catalase [Leptolyngbya sp. FACHB-541]|uniref:peroxidase family protein n=1 Tax=Leptolyngbya sp. FACHB-541 TaxID=2692810 RepID=UPI001681D72C|nr:peroxidase family protein [Leptolyngbya sp. FACHB-541]MBD1999279.1 catalase [Leptolyngbya sp. FACHB-541]
MKMISTETPTSVESSTVLTGTGWQEKFLGGSPESEYRLLKQYADDIQLVQERQRKKAGGTTVRRALHAKIQAGITNAEFRIDPAIPQHLQHGIFQLGKTYTAHVRLSNASGIVQPDTKRDLRGLALRIFSTDEQGQERINDLLMTSAPVSHARNVRQFMEFAKAASKRPTFLLPVRLLFSIGVGETIRMMKNVISNSSRKIGSLATETYWSRGPFQLGEAALQFFAQPAEGTPEVAPEKTDNYLREEFIERLKQGPVVFDIMAQLFVSEEKTPIEDGATRWQEKDSPPFRIAQLVIPQQDLGESRDGDAEALIQQTAFNPWNGAEIFRPLGQLNRGRQPVYVASEDFRLKRQTYVPPQSFLTRLVEGIFRLVNRFVRWDKLPGWLGIFSLAQLRTVLRQKNLYDTETEASREATARPRRCPVAFLTNRSPDGSYNDLSEPSMGCVGMRFGRNMPLDKVQRTSDERILTPNPRMVARELMTREQFQPATTLNILAAAWIQFMIHDWFSHETDNQQQPFEVQIDADDDWPDNQRPMHVKRTRVDPNHAKDAGEHPDTYINHETPWWDGSQIYGTSKITQNNVRLDQDGKLRVDDRGLLPKVEGEVHSIDGVEVTGVSANWWLGLGLMHTLFTLEHNAICDRLRAAYPTWNDEQLFNKARLVNTALLAKIHTVEWTPAILGHPALQIGMNANWWGLVGEKINKILGRFSKNEAITGIPGSPTNHFGVPYSLTEEFVAVYRMHPLLPDDFVLRSVMTDELIEEVPLEEAVGPKARAIMERLSLDDLYYSLGIAYPGAITLRNYPNFLRTLPRRDNRLVDLAAVDILRDRERGVPRYNEFRKLLRLTPIKSFDQLTPDPELARKIESIYDGKIDDVDLIIGMFAETPPKGFGFSDTAFRIFILMASRRLNSDRFFTVDYKPEIYSPVGLEWVENNTMISVLLRHYPALEPALRQSKNAFAPWNRVGV